MGRTRRVEWGFFRLLFVQKIQLYIYSEGGTQEDRRIDPPLNFGIFIENNNKIWEKWLRSSPRLIKKNSDPPLDIFRSALTEYVPTIIKLTIQK